VPFFFLQKPMNALRYFPTPAESFLLYLMVMGLNIGFSALPFMDFTGWFTWEGIAWINHLFAFGITIGTGLLLFRKRNGSVSSIFRKGDFCWCMTPSIMSLSLLAVIILWPLSTLLLPEELLDFFTDMYTSSSLSLCLALVITGPVLEEWLFRGLILNGSLKHTTPARAIIYSTLLFAFSHMVPSQIVAAIIIGSGIGWLYYKTGSIIPALLVHVMFNMGNYLLRFIYSPEQISALLQNERGFIPGVSPLLVWSLALISAVLIAIYLYRQGKAHTYALLD
jgi:membrane protease YdiL (CAAX protease family)